MARKPEHSRVNTSLARTHTHLKLWIFKCYFLHSLATTWFRKSQCGPRCMYLKEVRENIEVTNHNTSQLCLLFCSWNQITSLFTMVSHYVFEYQYKIGFVSSCNACFFKWNIYMKPSITNTTNDFLLTVTTTSSKEIIGALHFHP